jgi:hypothetical protein
MDAPEKGCKATEGILGANGGTLAYARRRAHVCTCVPLHGESPKHFCLQLLAVCSLGNVTVVTNARFGESG